MCPLLTCAEQRLTCQCKDLTSIEAVITIFGIQSMGPSTRTLTLTPPALPRRQAQLESTVVVMHTLKSNPIS